GPAAANLRGALVARRRSVAIDRFSRDRQPRSVGQHDGMEPDPKPRPLLELAAPLDLCDRPKHTRAGGKRDLVTYLHVARHACLDAIFDACALARDRRLG